MFEKKTSNVCFQDITLAKQLKCLMTSNCTNATPFFDECHNLVTLHTNAIEPRTLFSVISNNVRLASVSITPVTMFKAEDSNESHAVKRIVTKNGHDLTSIALGYVSSRLQLKHWASFSNLRRLEFASEASRLRYLKGIPNLRELKWRLSNYGESSRPYLKELLDTVGGQLVRLELLYSRVSWIELESCNNLEHLMIWEHSGWVTKTNGLCCARL